MPLRSTSSSEVGSSDTPSERMDGLVPSPLRSLAPGPARDPSLHPSPRPRPPVPLPSLFPDVPGEPATDEEWLAHRDDPIPQILTPALFHALDHYNLQLSLSLRQLLPPGEPRWCHTYTRLLSLLEPEEWSRMERLQRRELACFVRDGGETCSPEEWQERAYAKWRYEERVKRCCTLLLHFRQYVKLELDAGSSYEEIWQRLAPFEEDELPTKAERDARQLEIACIAEEEALRREEAIRREKEERDGEVERARSAGARRRPVALKRMQI